MTIARTLARAEADLAVGRLTLARQRVRGLVASFPTDLELRERLAALYRAEGVASQAGRWSFLAAEPDPVEQAAFVRAYRDPVVRMRALGWRGPEEAAGAVGEPRLRALRAEAEESAGAALTWEDARRPRPPRTLGETVAAVVGFGIVIVVFGGAAIALARWAVELVKAVVGAVLRAFA